MVGCINWMIVEVLDEGARPWWPLLVFPLPRPCYRPHDNRFVHSATVMMIPTYFLQLLMLMIPIMKTMVMMLVINYFDGNVAGSDCWFWYQCPALVFCGQLAL